MVSRVLTALLAYATLRLTHERAHPRRTPTAPSIPAAASSAVSVDEVTKGLGERKYNTATRGERVQPAAVVAGTCVFAFCLCAHLRTLCRHH